MSDETDAPRHTAGGQSGNDNARGRRDAATYVPPAKPPVPAWFRRAHADFARDAYPRSSRNWSSDPATGNASVRGRTIGVDKKAPDTSRPFFVDVPGQPRRWAATAVEARDVVERGIRDADDAAYGARLAAQLLGGTGR